MTAQSAGTARGSGAGKLVALFIAAAWIVSLVVYSAIRPKLTMSRGLFAAAQAGNMATVETLLRKGAVVNLRDKDSHTALWLAAAGGHAEVVQELLARGSDANARGVDGLTPLMAAAKNGDAATVRALMAHSADRAALGPNGVTALSLAQSAHHTEAAAALQAR